MGSSGGGIRDDGEEKAKLVFSECRHLASEAENKDDEKGGSGGWQSVRELH